MGTTKRQRQKANRAQRLLALERAQRKRRRNRTWLRGALFILVGAAAAVLISWLAFRNSNSNSSSGTSTTVAEQTTLEPTTTVPLPSTVPGATLTGDTPCPSADGSSARTVMFAKAPPMCIDAAKTYSAKIATSKGDITVSLDAAKAPQTVNNFVVLARYHYFDNTICHRIIQNFVVQCGDPTGTGSGPNPGYNIPDELPATPYAIGDLAMANTGSPNTGGSQFFIISGSDGAKLPQSYSLFGKVTDGLDTTVKALDAAHGPAPANGDAGGVPTSEQIVITSVSITES